MTIFFLLNLTKLYNGNGEAMLFHSISTILFLCQNSNPNCQIPLIKLKWIDLESITTTIYVTQIVLEQLLKSCKSHKPTFLQIHCWNKPQEHFELQELVFLRMYCLYSSSQHSQPNCSSCSYNHFSASSKALQVKQSSNAALVSL